MLYIYDSEKRLSKIEIGGNKFSVLYNDENAKEFSGVKSELTGSTFQRPMRRIGVPYSPKALADQKIWLNNVAGMKCSDFIELRTSSDEVLLAKSKSKGMVTLTEGDGDHEPPGWAHDMPDEYVEPGYWSSIVENDYFSDTYAYIDKERQKQCVNRFETCTGKCDTSGDNAETGCALFALAFSEIPIFAGGVAAACVSASKQIRSECKGYCGTLTQCF